MASWNFISNTIIPSCISVLVTPVNKNLGIYKKPCVWRWTGLCLLTEMCTPGSGLGTQTTILAV